MSWKDFLEWLLSFFVKPQPAPTPTPTPTPLPNSFIEKLLILHNNHRKGMGIGLLTLNTKLTNAAQKHTDWMYKNNNLNHNENGKNQGQRITEEGYRWSTYGENIAFGYSTPEAVFSGWLKSAGHRRNIESAAYKDVGIGFAGKYWTVDFAK